MHILKKHPFLKFIFYKGCLIFILLNSWASFSQSNSEEYLSIKKSTDINNIDKEKKIDSLFLTNKRTGNITSQFAMDLYDYGKWLYRHSSLEKALISTKESLHIIETLDEFDIIIHKKVVNNIGFLNAKLGNYLLAVKAYKKLTKIGERDKTTAESYRLSARYLALLGDLYTASQYYETAISIAKQLGEQKILFNSSIAASINYKNIATKQSFARGIEIMLSTVTLVENSSFSNTQPFSKKNAFSAYNNLGNLYNDREDYDFENSKSYYEKALTIALSTNDSLSIANIYNDIGYLYLHDTKKEALEYFEKSLLYKPANKATSTIFGNIGYYYLKVKMHSKALHYAQLSINELTPVSIKNIKSLPSHQEVSENLNKFKLLESLIDKSEIWLNLYEDNPIDKDPLKAALETLNLADYLVDIIRFENNERKSKLFWRKIASEIYTNAVKTCFKLNNAEKAFYFMEKNKALLLLEDVSINNQAEKEIIPEEITSRQFSFKKRILDYNTSLEANSSKKDSIRELLIMAKEDYNYFLDSIAATYSVYYKTQKPAKIISLRQVQKEIIQYDEVFIEYILGDSDAFGFVITKNDIHFFEINDTLLLNELSREYRGLLENPINSKLELDNYNRVSNSLFNLLIPEKILTSIKDKKITIIADSYLQNIPFEALQSSLELPHSYFIKTNVISYAYSITFLEQNKKVTRTNENAFLGFAPVYFDKMPSLLESKKEIDFGASQFTSITFFYKQATKQNFINNASGNSIIHFASHSNASESDSPWIAFYDEKLSLNELYLTKNSADLVVLSGCETSIGEFNQGEGVMSLARGFFNTGTNSVLSTLWNVNDKSSAKIISDFYKQLKKGKTKSEALRFAKLNYLKMHQLSELSPYYWSSFILVGDANHLQIESKNIFFYVLLLLFILLIISYIAYSRRNK